MFLACHVKLNDMGTNNATQLLRSLSAEQIRERLAELAAEEKALRTLLRAAVRYKRGRQQEARR